LLLAVPREKVGVLQGIMQAVTEMSNQAGIGWLVAPFAVLLSFSIAGIASAWLSGSARIPFVAGLDRYLPAALGKLHPRFATPHVALLVHAGFSAAFLAVSFVGAEVKEAFVTLLDLAVVLQLVPFLYMYAALIQLSRKGDATEGHYSKRTLLVAGICGFASTAIGMAVAFVPSHQITSIWLFELKMWLGTLFFIGLAGFFFFVYSRRKMAQGETRSV
jgi:amino acid transporter